MAEENYILVKDYLNSLSDVEIQNLIKEYTKGSLFGDSGWASNIAKQISKQGCIDYILDSHYDKANSDFRENRLSNDLNID